MKKKSKTKHLVLCTTLTLIFIQFFLAPLYNISYAQENLSPSAVAEKPSNRVKSRFYLASSNQTTILKENGENKLLIKDYLGSTRVVSTDDGTISSPQYYYPYGGMVEENSIKTVTDKGFTGHRLVDEAEVYQAGMRFYSPQFGRFIQPDKVEPGDRYGYVHNNPIQGVDQTGEFWHIVALTAIGAVAGAAIMGGREALRQIREEGGVTDPMKVFKQAGKGALVGGVAGAALSVGITVAGHAISSAASQVAGRVVANQAARAAVHVVTKVARPAFNIAVRAGKPMIRQYVSCARNAVCSTFWDQVWEKTIGKKISPLQKLKNVSVVKDNAVASFVLDLIDSPFGLYNGLAAKGGIRLSARSLNVGILTNLDDAAIAYSRRQLAKQDSLEVGIGLVEEYVPKMVEGGRAYVESQRNINAPPRGASGPAYNSRGDNRNFAVAF